MKLKKQVCKLSPKESGAMAGVHPGQCGGGKKRKVLAGKKKGAGK